MSVSFHTSSPGSSSGVLSTTSSTSCSSLSTTTPTTICSSTSALEAISTTGALVRANSSSSVASPQAREITVSSDLDLSERGLTSFTLSMHNWNGITVLQLHKNNLSELPEEIGLIATLKSLYIDENLLTKLPAGIGNLKELEWLAAYKNKLTEIPEELGQCKKLNTLYLENNELCSIPNCITYLPLTDLDLSNNNLTTLPHDIGRLQDLEELRFYGNPILYLPDSFRNLNQDCEIDGDQNVPIGVTAFAEEKE